MHMEKHSSITKNIQYLYFSFLLWPSVVWSWGENADSSPLYIIPAIFHHKWPYIDICIFFIEAKFIKLNTVKWTIQWPFVHTQYYASILSNFRFFFNPKENSIPISSYYLFSSPSTHWQLPLCLVSINFPILNISYKWTHTLYTLLSGFF